ncbi:MAG TPA: energy-coupling factor ABC transporter permease [Bryobacteraceae bacterium]|nr:energy-coupling factor ABC transporter permease [Bryobacteraceae bacterium]
MHIPDGFLATPVWLGLDAVCVPAVAYLARRAQREMDEARVPVLGVMGAFVFAAQMINFPVGVGTSGHLVGSALLTVTLGPAAAAIAMTAILAIQALVFQDGGILALGANVFNMAIAGVLAAWLPYRWPGTKARRPAVFLAAALSVFTGAMLAILELRLSGVPMPTAVLSVSIGIFALTALIEGAITVAVVEAIGRLSPRLIARKPAAQPGVLAGLGVAAVLLATVGAVFASTNPDGLEAFTEKIGIADHARTLIATPFIDYEAQFLSAPWLQVAAAGLVGLALVAAALWLFGRASARRRSA